VITRSHIGYGAPNKQDTREAHGEALGAEETSAAKRALGWPDQPTFRVPDDVRPVFARRAAEVLPEAESWRRNLARWKERHPDRAALWDAHIERRIPRDVMAQLLASAPTGAAATRVHGNAVLQKAAALVPALVGGSADLEPSTRTRIAGSPSVQKNAYQGRNLHFGVREHGMASIMNGMALHGGILPYGGTFLIFSDYMRPAVRLASIMRQRVIFVYTHDSIGLGEDGPTHQPIEQLSTLRAIPDFTLIRPADASETAEAWKAAVNHEGGPVALVLTRQKLGFIDRERYAPASGLARGAYVLADPEGAAAPRVVLLSSGSEVALILAAHQRLAEAGVASRVVSMPSMELFERQPPDYQDSVLPHGIPRVSIEAAHPMSWYRWVGSDGVALGLDRFGASAPYERIYEELGLTVDAIVDAARRVSL
jgi:transketolase